MRKLTMYNFITLNGFYKGINEDIRWHRHGSEEEGFSQDSLQHKNTLVFGRVTYQMMASYWPTAMAMESMPEVAKGMNSAEKIVFSNTLTQTDWQNTKILTGDIIETMRNLKQQSGNDMTILGSGSIVSQMANANLIDNYEIMIDPVAIGNGTPLFKGIDNNLNLKLTNSRVFKSGVILLSYEP
ncbi:dihydrofolate reductase family protein [Flavobacterium sp. C4GT6]|uniref:dihydrofolate reductase family protein n=1 Tax=Flavobacterium sp. C4GT6 TaxID=3103818 RepID=UPI002ED1753E